MIRKILRLFVNTLKVDDKHYLLNRDNLTQPIQMQSSEKQKKIPEILFAFLTSISNFKHSPRNMTFRVYVFPVIPVPKNMFR